MTRANINKIVLQGRGPIIIRQAVKFNKKGSVLTSEISWDFFHPSAQNKANFNTLLI